MASTPTIVFELKKKRSSSYVCTTWTHDRFPVFVEAYPSECNYHSTQSYTVHHVYVLGPIDVPHYLIAIRPNAALLNGCKDNATSLFLFDAIQHERLTTLRNLGKNGIRLFGAINRLGVDEATGRDSWEITLPSASKVWVEDMKIPNPAVALQPFNIECAVKILTGLEDTDLDVLSDCSFMNYEDLLPSPPEKDEDDKDMDKDDEDERE